LSCVAKSGREHLEDWKVILRGLIERGLRRVMIFIQDGAAVNAGSSFAMVSR